MATANLALRFFLELAGQVPIAIAFGVLVVGNAALLFVFGEDARSVLAGATR